VFEEGMDVVSKIWLLKEHNLILRRLH